MRIIIVSGFLGSGKTTLILNVAREMVTKGSKVAIIENDFGQVNIDSQMMTRAGLTVREMSMGCICCTLGPDFLMNLKELAVRYSPETIIVEPSGIANSDTILSALDHYTGPPIESVKAICIVDGARFFSMIPAFEVGLLNNLRAADLICLNKVDNMKNEEIVQIDEWLESKVPDRPVVHLSLKEGMGFNKVLEEVGI